MSNEPSTHTDDDVWVEVEMLKGGMIGVYRGRLAQKTFDAWRHGEITRGTIELQEVYWSYDDGEGNEGWVVVGATPGPYASAVGSICLRVDLIMVMVPLRDGAEREAHRLRPIGGRGDD